jgi:hypothetical protein
MVNNPFGLNPADKTPDLKIGSTGNWFHGAEPIQRLTIKQVTRIEGTQHEHD